MLRMHDNRMSRREHKGMGKSAYACTEVCLVPVFFLRGGWGAPEPTANLGIGHVRVRSRIHNGGPPVRWTSLHEHVFERSTCKTNAGTLRMARDSRPCGALT